MDREVLVRRLIHGLIALAPLYYLLPVELDPIPVRRWVLLITFLGAIIGFEVFRLAKGMTFFGLRPHEKTQIASFAWAAAGVVITLWLFPQEIASVAIVGMAIVDPLAGEMRRSRFKDRSSLSISLVAYLVLAFSLLLVISDFDAIACLAMAALGSALAIPSEWFEVPHVDDDFLMMVVPAVGMTALSLLL